MTISQTSRRISLPTLILIGLLLLLPTRAQAQIVVADVGLGSRSLAMAYDSGVGEIFVGQEGTNVSVISDTTNQMERNITLGSYGGSLAYDSGKGEIFAGTEGNGTAGPIISVISDKTDARVATIPLAGHQMVYDSGMGEIFVACPGSSQGEGGFLLAQSYSTIQIISDSNNTVVGDVQVGQVPPDLRYDNNSADGPIPVFMAYDSGKGEIFVTNYVANYSSDALAQSTVSVISDKTNSVVATVNINGGTIPQGLAYDSAKGEVFVADSNGTDVSVISDSTNTVVAAIRVEPSLPGNATEVDYTLGVAYDAADGEVFVSNAGSYLPNTVSIISDSTDKVVSTVVVGYGPSGVVYDSGRGEVFVVNSGSDTISVISEGTPTAEFPSTYAVPIVFVSLIFAMIAVYRFKGNVR
jgi:YVTN family beta-propeller protein